ncbi:conserved Plasmodium protein, unknown function [Plasmodium ovale wallikeri]|uniref:Uncharacterized protein n=2 Tax=Plasmodium ovale TaxID=36330 RepID=A0A1C3KRA2_PLAOA|nr:conserved Plasmodium protein, unknown function [Plasmodium ovale wallikeri]SBT76665.1 conserved Plasmodium protein, unknown function [Plasmodium ovale]
MNDRKRSINVVAGDNTSHCEKYGEVGKGENIKKLSNLLDNYTGHNAPDDVSDFLASSYKNFLIDRIYEELKFATKRDINYLIGICLDIIQNNHKVLKYQNIYFICLNTLFLLLNRVDGINQYMEYLSCKIFLDLVYTTDWRNDNHIEVFGKLNYISLFILSNVFKKYSTNVISDEFVTISRVNKMVKYAFFDPLHNEKDHTDFEKRKITEYIHSDYTGNISIESLNVEKCFHFMASFKKDSSQSLNTLSSTNREERKNLITLHDDKENRPFYKKIKIVNYKESFARKKEKIASCITCFDTTVSRDDLIFKIYSTVIQLAIKQDVTIYIIYECVNIILNLCELNNMELALIDFLILHKFYIKNDKKILERFIVFVIQLITKCKSKYRKGFFFKLMRNLNTFLHLLHVDNSDIRMFTKECLLSLHFFKQSNNENMLQQNDTTSNDKINKRVNVEKEMVRIMNITLFHMNYIYDVSRDICVDRKLRSSEYDMLFKNAIGQNPLLKNYIYDQIETKKGKLFFKNKNIFDKKIVIRNHIIEMENMVKMIDCLFIFISDKFWSIYFILFFMYGLDTINKIHVHLPSEYSEEFFFLIKNMFIQAIYVFENMEKVTLDEEEVHKIMECLHSGTEESYEERSKIQCLWHRIIQKMIERIKRSSRLRDVKGLFVLLEDLYFTVINFLMPKDKKWVFFNPSNFHLFEKLMLRISHFYYQRKKTENITQFFFFESFFRRIKKKIKWKLDLKKKDREDVFQSVLLNYGKSVKHLYVRTKKFISLEEAAYFTFCLDFLKTLVLYDNSHSYASNERKYKKSIIIMCRALILIYKFFLPARSVGNCFSQSITVLYHLYVSIYKTGKGKKLMQEIIYIILACSKKSLSSMKKDHVIFYHNDVEHVKKRGELTENTHDQNSQRRSNAEKEKTENQIIITNKFEKPFKEYYLNNSSHTFATCLDVLTNIIKLSILRCKICRSDVTIKKSKIKMRKKKQHKCLRRNGGSVPFSYIYLSNLCKCLINKTNEDFFYSTRKYVLNFIKHFITLNTILVLKHKFKNNLNLEKILSFCFYNIFTDYDVGVFSIIYSIAFSLKNYISLCGTKIKKANHYLEICDDLIFQIVHEYETYDFPETSLWEEYISKTVSFDSLKYANVDCPGE